MYAEQLWATIETPDGVVVPGIHGTSAASRAYPSLSSAVYVIENGGEALVADPGSRFPPEYPPGVLDTVCAVLDDRGVDVTHVVQTEWHADHSGNTEYVADRYDAPILCHPRERAVIENPASVVSAEYLESFGADAAEVARDFGVEDPGNLIMPADVSDHWDEPMRIDDTVEGGDVLEVGELEVEVLHTPGHTPGHLSLYVPRSSSLYLGDATQWPTPVLPYPAGDTAEHVESLRTCLDREADYAFPGHGLPRCGALDVRDYIGDMLIKQRQVENRVLTLLNRHGPLTVAELHAECFVVEFRYNYPMVQRGGGGMRHLATQSLIQSQLRWLVDRGEVERIERDDGTIAWTVTEEGALPDEETAVRDSYERSLVTHDDLDLGPRS